MSAVELAVFVANGATAADPRGAGEPPPIGPSASEERDPGRLARGSPSAAAEPSLEYAARTLASFERHHLRFAADPVVYVAEVTEDGPAPEALAAELHRRLPRLRATVVTVGLPLLRGVVAASRAHLARDAELVQQWLVALAVTRARRRWVLSVQPGAVFVEDDAVDRLRARAEEAGALVAGRLRDVDHGPARLDPAVLLVDAERLLPRFPVEAWLETAASAEDRLRRVRPAEVAERARATRAADLLAVLAAWLQDVNGRPGLLRLADALEGFGAGDAGAFASRALVSGRYLEPAGAADLGRAVERARLPRAQARAIRRALALPKEDGR